MSNNQLNDISKVYLSQISEETPGERIDRKSQEGVAKRKAAAASETEARAKKAGEFQKHKQSVLAKGGRHVDALDSWHKKQAYERNAKLREEIKGNKKAKKSIEPQESVANDKVENQLSGMMSSESYMSKDKEGHTTGGFRISNKEASAAKDRLHKNRRISIKMGSAAQDLAKMEKDDDAFGAPNPKKVKKEDLSDWRTDLSDLIEVGPLSSSPSLSQDTIMRDNQNLDQVPSKKHRLTQTEFEKEVTEKKVNNKIIINPIFQESIREIGGEVLEAEERKEVKAPIQKPKEKLKKPSRSDRLAYNPPGRDSYRRGYKLEQVEIEEKDSYKTVAAVIDYDRSKKGSEDATYDSDHGKKKAAKKERDYAAWEREKMKRDDPNWKHKKYHTGMHGEEVQSEERKEVKAPIQKPKEKLKKPSRSDRVAYHPPSANWGGVRTYRSESVEADEYLETVSKVKKSENEADKERWAVDEAVKGESTQDRKDAAAERRRGVGKLLPKKEGESYAKWTMAKDKWAKRKKGEIDEQLDDKKKVDDPAAAEKQEKQLQSKEKRISQMKKMVLLKKMQAVRSGAGAEITASYEPEGEVIDETLMSVKAATYGMPNEKRKAIIDKYKRSEENRGTDKKKGRDAGAIARERLNKEETIIERSLTGYEDKKKEEVIKALKKKKPEFKKRYGKDAADVMYAVATKTAKKKGDTSKSDDRYAYEEIEFAVDYFYEQGINEDGLDLIIEEIGLDAFVEFVLNPSEELMEERAARKMNVRTKKKMPAIVASDAEAEAKRRAGKTGEYKETPKKKAKVGAPAYTTTVKSEPKKKEAPKPVAKPVVKKVEKAVVKVKPTQPKKEVSKGGLRDRISGAVKAGVKRHKKAVQPARVFAKGVKAGVKSTVKFAGKAKKAIVGEEVIDEGNCEDCGCKGCGKNPCVECGEDHHKLGEETKSVEKKKKETLQKIKKDAQDILKQDEIHSKIEEAKVDAGKTPHEKETIRNQRNTPPGANTKFDTSVFITRKSGESPTSARGRKRREAHAKRRGVKEDKAFDNVVRALRKKYGKDAVLTKDSPKPKASSQPKRKTEKDKRSSAQREVDAQYGRTPWNKKGSLGT